MKTWIYSWIIYPALYSVAVCLGFFNKKIRETMKLRSWKDFLSLRFNAGHPIEYWVHVASSGELEYALPILGELGRRGKRVLITYYSISAKKPVEQLPALLPNVSLVVPLPHDGLGLMREFVTLVRRQGVRNLLLMKYELWPGLLWECNAHGIKVILVDALKPGWFHRKLLHKLDGIFSGYSSEIDSLAHQNARVVGDTRVERVLERVGKGEGKIENLIPPEIKAALKKRPVFICGSMWPEDSDCALEALELLKRNGEAPCHLIWVPHELEETEERRVSEKLLTLGYQLCRIDDHGVRFESLQEGPLAIIVMRKGILVELYRFGKAAFVGGGFGPGVHSVWEPAIAGCHVACGPKTSRSPESTQLADKAMLTRVHNAFEMNRWLLERLGSTRLEETALASVLAPHLGAAKRIVEICEVSSG